MFYYSRRQLGLNNLGSGVADSASLHNDLELLILIQRSQVLLRLLNVPSHHWVVLRVSGIGGTHVDIDDGGVALGSALDDILLVDGVLHGLAEIGVSRRAGRCWR